MNQRPFRVLGVQQIAVGAPDKRALTKLWGETLGLPTTGSYRSEAENVDEDILSLGSGPLGVELDLMQPIDPDRSPRVHQPALNHVGLWVDDLAAAHLWLVGQGVRFTPGGIRKGASGHDVCFIHPKGSESSPLSGEGVLIELVQAPPEVREAFGAARAGQASPEKAPALDLRKYCEDHAQLAWSSNVPAAGPPASTRVIPGMMLVNWGREGDCGYPRQRLTSRTAVCAAKTSPGGRR